MAIVSEKPLIEILSPEEQHDRFDINYYLPEFIHAERYIDDCAIELTTLGDVMTDDASYGVLPPSSSYLEEGGISLVRSSNVSNSGIDYESAVRVPSEWINSERARIKSNDVLISIKGARAFFDMCVASDNPPDAIVNGSIFRFQCKEEYDPKFVVLWLLSKPIQSMVFRERANLGISYISSGVLSDIPFPNIDIEQQRHILKRHHIFSDKIQELSDKSAASSQVMGGFFDDPLANLFQLKPLKKSKNKVWIATPVGTMDQLTCRYYDPYLVDSVHALNDAPGGVEPLSIYAEIFRGRTPGKSDYEYDDPSEYKIIKCNHMDWEGGFSELEEVKKSWGMACEEMRLKPGDILISCIGSGSIGKVVRWTSEENHETVIPVSEITVCRPKDSKDSVFLELFLQSSYGLRQLLRNETGGTGQTHLYPEQIKQVLVPKKNDGEWDRFVTDALKALEDYRQQKRETFNRSAKIRSLANQINNDLLELADDEFYSQMERQIEEALQ